MNSPTVTSIWTHAFSSLPGATTIAPSTTVTARDAPRTFAVIVAPSTVGSATFFSTATIALRPLSARALSIALTAAAAVTPAV